MSGRRRHHLQNGILPGFRHLTFDTSGSSSEDHSSPGPTRQDQPLLGNYRLDGSPDAASVREASDTRQTHLHRLPYSDPSVPNPDIREMEREIQDQEYAKVVTETGIPLRMLMNMVHRAEPLCLRWATQQSEQQTPFPPDPDTIKRTIRDRQRLKLVQSLPDHYNYLDDGRDRDELECYYRRGGTPRPR